MAEKKNEQRIVTRAGSATEAAIVRGRLTEAGIRTMLSPGRWGGGRAVYVDEQDFERARSVLKADEGGFSEEELARLSEEAGSAPAEEDSSSAATEPASPACDGRGRAPDAPVATPVLKKHRVFNVLKRITQGKPAASSPENPFGH